MSCLSNFSDINETFIVEPVGAIPTLTACTGVYTDIISSCSGNTQIFMGSGIITFDGNIYTNDNITASTINASTFYSGGTNIIDIINNAVVSITGGTFSNATDTLSLYNNKGSIINVTGFTDYYTTGTTLIGKTAYFDTNEKLSAYTLNLNSFSTTDTFSTGVTFSGNQIIIARNDGINLGAFINTFTGLTINGTLNVTDILANSISANTISATTFYGDGSRLTGISTQDTRISAFTYASNTFKILDTTGGTFNALFNTLTGLTVNGNLIVTGSTNLDTLSATSVSASTYYNVSSNFQYEIHVSQVDGNNTTGTGTLLNPVASITKALTLVDSQRKTIVVHPGTYTENPSINTQYTVLTTFEIIGGNTLISGTVSATTGCTISGLKMTNLTITAPTGSGNVNILNCEISGTLTKSSTADYTLIRFCDIGITDITGGGGGTVAIFGGNPNFITVNNAGARVLVKNAVTFAPVLAAGSLTFADCVLFSTGPTTNAFTAAAGTFTTLANSQIIIPTFQNVARISLGGIYSILNCVYDRPNSTLSAYATSGGFQISGSTNSIVYSQFINADKFITQGGTLSQYVMGDGSLSNGFTGGTVTGATIFTAGLSANTISATTYQNLPKDVFVTGGTYTSNTGTIGFINNTGGTFNVSGLFKPSDDIYATGFTFNASNYDLTIKRNGGLGDLTQSLAILASDLTITGGTYNPNSGVATFTNNTGGTFNVSGFATGLTDTYTTGFTYNNNTLTISDTAGNSYSVLFNTLTGVTINGNMSVTGNTTLGSLTATSISASTYQNLPKDIFVTGGTYSAGTTTFTNNTGGTFSVSGFSISTATQFTGGTVTGATIFTGGLSANTVSATTYYNLPLDIRTTGASYSNNTFTYTNNTGGTYSTLFNTVTGLTVNGNITVTGNTSLQALTATTISASSYNNLPNTLYTGDGNVSGNRIVGLDGFSLRFSSTSATNAFVIGASGNVGIGTISPTNRLHITASTDPMRVIGLTANTSDANILSIDSNGVIHTYPISSISGGSSATFTGGTVNGATRFTAGLTANTISATTYFNLPLDIRVTGATYNNNTFIHTNNTGGTYSVLFNTVTGLTVNGNLTVTGNTSLRALTATTISATTYSNLPNTLYTGNGTLSGNRIVSMGTNTLNFSSSTYSNNLVLSGGNVGIGTASPSANLHVGNNTSFLKVTPDWFTPLGGVGGTWLDLSLDGPSGVGSGGPGANPFFAYAAGAGQWFTNSEAGDVAYRNTSGKLLFGNTSGETGMALFEDKLGVGVVSPIYKLDVYSTSNPLRLQGLTASTTDLSLLSVDSEGVVHSYLISNISGGTSGVGEYLFLSGGTVTGATRFTAGLTANTVSATTYLNLPLDIRTTGVTYISNTFIHTNNTGGTYSVLFNTVTGLTINGNLTVTGNTSLQALTANTISATTYLNLPSSSSTFTGGTINGATIFTAGLSATTISASTYLNLPSTLYTGNGTLSSNRIIDINGYSLNFSSSTYNNNLVLSGGNVGMGILSPTNKLHVSAIADPVKFVGLQNASDTSVLTVDGTGVVHTIASSSLGGGGLAWNNAIANITASTNNGYVGTASTLTTITLPTTAAFGTTIEVVGTGTGLWKISQNVNQSINFGIATTTTGTAGYLSATSQYDCVKLLCTSGNTTFVVTSSIGNIFYN